MRVTRYYYNLSNCFVSTSKSVQLAKKTPWSFDRGVFLLYRKLRKNSFARSDVNKTMLATWVQAQSAFLLYRKLRFYTVKNLLYCRAKFFEKQKIAFQKCTWLKKSEFAPHVRRRRCGEAAFLALQWQSVSKHVFISLNQA